VFGLVINATPSMPLGVWKITERHPAVIASGDVILYCPPPSEITRKALSQGIYASGGSCDSGLVPLIKRVAGRAGDHVVVNKKGVWINHHLLQDSRALHIPGIAPVWRSGTLSTTMLWLHSDHEPRGFDSRYFGPAQANDVVATLVPLWVW